MTYTLSMFNTGQITLPKQWRNRFKGKKFIAQETAQGLLIQPLEAHIQSPINDSNIILIEDSTGSDIQFKNGIDPQVIIDRINNRNE